MKEKILVNEKSILSVVKQICLKTLTSKDFAVDMTIGNGFDTLFLASIITEGMVFGFDIQQIALNNTTNLLEKNQITNYKLFLENHENINQTLVSYKEKIKIILFNLGYLPKGDKKITTNHNSTLRALQNSFEMLKKDGLILIVFYPHEEGKKEAKVIEKYLTKETIKYKEYHNTENKEAPFLITISKP